MKILFRLLDSLVDGFKIIVASVIPICLLSVFASIYSKVIYMIPVVAVAYVWIVVIIFISKCVEE